MDQDISSKAPAGSARRRLLDTATRLFYAGGIHAVGIDRIIAEAGVAKATFYKHFPSKDDLVVAYLEEIDRLGRAQVAAHPKQSPRERISAIMERISAAVAVRDWRGCPFVNAAAEYPDRESPVRKAINARREWYHDTLRSLLVEDGDPNPSLTAALLVAISDGLLESAYLDGPENVPALVGEALDRLLNSGEQQRVRQ
jgi:AcrR family transcriptional regulator